MQKWQHDSRAGNWIEEEAGGETEASLHRMLRHETQHKQTRQRKGGLRGTINMYASRRERSERHHSSQSAEPIEQLLRRSLARHAFRGALALNDQMPEKGGRQGDCETTARTAARRRWPSLLREAPRGKCKQRLSQ